VSLEAFPEAMMVCSTEDLSIDLAPKKLMKGMEINRQISLLSKKKVIELAV
jgi:hypothetical protein